MQNVNDDDGEGDDSIHSGTRKQRHMQQKTPLLRQGLEQRPAAVCGLLCCISSYRSGGIFCNRAFFYRQLSGEGEILE